MTRRTTATMHRTPTISNVYTVVVDGETVLETLDFREACKVRRDCAGELVTVPRDVSPS